MTSKFQRHVREQRQAALDALAQLRAALEAAGIVLPSLGLDHQSPYTGTVLVELGAARPDVVQRLARAVRRGTDPTSH